MDMEKFWNNYRNFEDLEITVLGLRKELLDLLVGIRGYGSILGLILIVLSISSVHLSAIVLSIPAGLRPIVDVGTASTLSMTLWVHLVISAVLGRVIVSCFSAIWWSFKINLNISAVFLRLVKFPIFLLDVSVGKEKLSNVLEGLELRPVLIDAALSLGKAGVLGINGVKQLILTVVVSVGIFLWSYLGFINAIQALGFMCLLVVFVFFPLAALHFYSLAKELADVKQMPEFRADELALDVAVDEAKGLAFAIKNIVYMSLVLVISASAISGVMRLRHLQQNTIMLEDRDGELKLASLILTNSQGYLLWNPNLGQYYFVSYVSDVVICDFPAGYYDPERNCGK